MYKKVHGTLYVLAQSWKWSTCSAAVECVVVHLFVGILTGKKNEQATGISRTWMNIIKIMFIGRSQIKVEHILYGSIYITGRKHVCGFWSVGNVLFFYLDSPFTDMFYLWNFIELYILMICVLLCVYDCFNMKFN